jgi:hypothetical protein
MTEDNMKKTYEAPMLVSNGTVADETKNGITGSETGSAAFQSLTGRVGFYL